MIASTKCLNCGMTLTTADGVRKEEANFSSDLPHKTETVEHDMFIITWARCNTCYEVAQRNKQRL